MFQMVTCDGLLALTSSADRAAERAIEQLNYVPLLPPNTPKGALPTISHSPEDEHISGSCTEPS